MKLRAALLCGMALAVGGSVAARADTQYSPGGSVDGFSGSGTLYAVSNGGSDGIYTITGVDGPGITGLIAAGGFDGNQNQLFPNGSPALNHAGFAFTDTMGDTGFQVDIFGNADGSYGAHIVDSDGVVMDDAATFALGSPASTSRVLHSALLQEGDLSGDGTQAFLFRFTTAEAIATTPEPGSFALMGTGLLGAAALVRRRARRLRSSGR